MNKDQKSKVRHAAKALLGVTLRGSGAPYPDDRVRAFIEESGIDRAQIAAETKDIIRGAESNLTDFNDILEAIVTTPSGERVWPYFNQAIFALDSEQASILIPALWNSWMRPKLADKPRMFLIESNKGGDYIGYQWIDPSLHYAGAECRYPTQTLGKTFLAKAHLFVETKGGALRPMPYPELPKPDNKDG